MVFDGAVGELIGEPHRGMRAMFTMMNAARLGVGIQGLALAQESYVRAAAYARERLQGRALGGAARPDLEADPIIVHPDVRRTLLRIRSQVEGGRALALWVAAEIDRAEAGDAAAADLVALMTPIVKAGLTDLATEATNLALGVFGGAGYIRETGMEQLVRDARITSIYEGTNGVQALDLVGRKLPEGAGRLLRRFFHPSLELLDEACADERLADIAGPRPRRAPPPAARHAVARRAGAGRPRAGRRRRHGVPAAVLPDRARRAVGAHGPRRARPRRRVRRREARHGALLRRPDAARDLGAGAAGDGGQGDADGAARAPVLGAAGHSSPARVLPIQPPCAFPGRSGYRCSSRPCTRSSRRAGWRSGSEPTAPRWPGPRRASRSRCCCAARDVTGLPILATVLAVELVIDSAAGFPAIGVAGIAATNVIEPLLGALLYRALARTVAAPDLSRPRDALRLGACVIVAPALANVIAASAVVAADMTDVSRWTAWLSFSAGDSFGIVTTLPFFLAIAQRRARWSLELLVSVAATVCAVTVVFLFGDGVHLYLAALPMLWAAIRLGPFGASATSIGLVVTSAFLTGRGRGPFASQTVEKILDLQVALVSLDGARDRDGRDRRCPGAGARRRRAAGGQLRAHPQLAALRGADRARVAGRVVRDAVPRSRLRAPARAPRDA